MNGAFVQEDRLWTADPKVLNYILQKSGYLYVKPRSAQERTALVAGRGISWAQGEFPTMTGYSLLLACLTIPQAMSISATGE